MHFNIASLLGYFKYEHLPEHLQGVSRPFCEMAKEIAEKYSGPETTAGLRKLLEAKDCIVRASMNEKIVHKEKDSSSNLVDVIN